MRDPPFFAEQAGGLEHQHDDQHDEGEDVLVMAAEEAAAQVADIARPQRLDDAEQDAAGHRAGEVADTAEHGGGKRLEAEHEAHLVMRDLIVGADHDAGQRAER